ncbi:MAG: hypothetical protein KDB27_00070, partial [Planctomycetales bacterium]|nr:hypothetical protein [Planctomycetales bacterium]
MARATEYKGIYIDANGKRGFNGLLYSGNAYMMQKHSFYYNCVRDLDLINANAIGKDLLKLIGQRFDGIGTSGHGAERAVTIYFRPSSKSEGASTGASGNINDKYRVTKNFGRREFQFAGVGSKVSIDMHNDENSAEIYTRLCGRPTPTWVVLAHELIHAWHTLSGTNHRETVQVVDQGTVAREEMYTTGLGAYADTRISENAIRRAARLPER